MKAFFSKKSYVWLAGLLCGIAVAWAAASHGAPQEDVAPFDPAAAKRLSAEKRREYDVIFFNELATWRENSRRCGGVGRDLRIDRENLFKKMAADGFETAHVALQVFKFRQGRIEVSIPAWNRLKALAEEGDTTAMCALPFFWGKMGPDKLPDRYEDFLYLIQRGAKAGHGACIATIGALHYEGQLGYPKDRGIHLEMQLEGARQGYYLSHLGMFNRYRKAGFDDPKTISKGLCWGRLADSHAPWAMFDYYLLDMNIHFRPKRPDGWRGATEEELYWRRLMDKWDPRITPHEAMPTKPEECIALEREE